MRLKKNLLLFSIIILILAILSACSGDENTEETPAPEAGEEHTHQYGEWFRVTAPSCAEVGEEKRECSCGASEIQQVAKTEHSLINSGATLPTCSTAGYTESAYCSFCGEVIVGGEVIVALGHTPTTLSGAEPICSAKGYTEGVVCSVCNTVIAAREEIPALGHDYDTENILWTRSEDGTVLAKLTCLTNADHSVNIIAEVSSEMTREAGCESEGNLKLTATVVYEGESYSKVYNDSIAQKGHTREILPSSEPTCLSVGKTEGEWCSDCEKIFTPQTQIEKKKHTEVLIPAKAPTCNNSGNTEGVKCTTCNTVLTEPEHLDRLAHSTVTTTVAPTCTESGYTETKCILCDTSHITNQKAPLGHTAQILQGKAASCTEGGLSDGRYCTVCKTNYEPQTVIAPLGHKESVIPKVEATCSDTGLTEGKKCLVCGEVLTKPQTVEKTDHSFNTEIILPTCTEKGYSVHKCKYCDNSYTDTFVNAKGHTASLIPKTAPTCTLDGLSEGSYCSACGVTLVEQTAVSKTGHTEKTIPAKAPTCIEEGYTAKIICALCSFVIEDSRVLDKLHHSYSMTTVPPSCAASGYNLYTCSVCSHSYTDSQTSSLGHSYSQYEKDITSGKTISVCVGCNDVKEAVAIEAVYNGGRLYTGDRVYKSKLKVTITLSDGTKFETSSYTLSGDLMTVGGTNIVNVIFGGLETVVAVEAIIGNVAGTTPITSFTYKESGGTITITAYSGTESIVIVPAHVNGVPVTAINASVFKSKTNITSLTIPGSVTTIGKGLCAGCTSLTSLTLNEGLSSIGSNAFAGCPITELVIPDSVTEILCGTNNDGAFEDCVQLKSVIIGDGLGTISSDTFRGCSSLKSVVIGESVGEIGTYAFASCSTLSEITFGENVFRIGANAFNRCEALKEISLPEGLISIGVGAFRYCSSLEEIVTPKSLTTIEYQAFCDCPALKAVTLNEGLTTIGYSAFYESAITEIYIPDSVTRISSGSNDNNGAFEGCAMLEAVVIGDGLATIEGYTFKGCARLKTVVIGNGTTKLNKHAFSECSSLTDVFLGENLITIANYAFYKCTSLESIVIPSTVQTLGDDAFSGCTLLKDISIGTRVQTIGEYAFRSCTSLKSVLIPASVQTIGSQAFKSCTELTSITIEGGNLTKISSDVIEDCTNIKRIYFLGTEEEWNAISINTDNVYPLNGTPYFYSLHAPETEGNYWHYGYDGVEKVWDVTEDAYTADAYTEELLDLLTDNESYAEQLVDELSDNALFVSTVVFWESGHIISQPSHAFEGGYISRKDLYKLALYDVLGVDDDSIPVLFDNCEKEAAENLIEIAKIVVGVAEKIPDLKKIPAEGILSVLEQNDSFLEFGMSDAFELIVSKAENAYDAIANFARYIAIASMSDQIKMILDDLAENAKNADLKAAAKDISDIMEKTCAAALTAITKGEYMAGNLDMISTFILDTVWSKILFTIPGAEIVTGAMKGVRFLASFSEFELDGMVQAFYMLQVNVNIENALGRYVSTHEKDYLRYENKGEAKTYVSAMRLYEDTWINGYDYVVSMYEAMDMSEGTINGVKEKKATLDTWFTSLDEQIKTDYKIYNNPQNVNYY